MRSVFCVVIVCMALAACKSAPEVRKRVGAVSYEAASEYDLKSMELSTGGVRKALLLVSDELTPDESFFPSDSFVLVMKEGYSNTRYSVCSSRYTPTIEIGQDEQGFPVFRITVPERVNCLSVRPGISVGGQDFTQFTGVRQNFWFRLVPRKKALFVMFSGLEVED